MALGGIFLNAIGAAYSGGLAPPAGIA